MIETYYIVYNTNHISFVSLTELWANEQIYCLIVSDYCGPWTSALPEASQIRCWLLGNREKDGDGGGFGVWSLFSDFVTDICS